MKNLQDASEKICELKGELYAMQILVDALFRALPNQVLHDLAAEHAKAVETARVVLLNSANAGEFVISSFEHHSENLSSSLATMLQSE